jgi:hypothetical protein
VTDTPEPVNTSWRIAFAWAALGFTGGVVWWLLLYGKADNSLHASALSWAFMISGGVLAGVGFGAISNLIPSVFGKGETK